MNARHVQDEWNACRAWLLPTLDDETEDELLNELLLSRAQLWRGERSAMVTQLVTDDEPYMLVWKGGGSLRDLLAMQPGVEAWARQQGARSVWINGRRGWSRALRRAGYETVGENFRKVL